MKRMMPQVVKATVLFLTLLISSTLLSCPIEAHIRIDALTLETDENQLSAAVIDPDNGFAYFGTRDFPGKIVKINLSDFTRVAEITLDSGENGIGTAIIDTVNGFAYFTPQYPYAAHVIKIRLSDFTRVDTLVLERSPSSAAIDTVNGFAYFGAYMKAFKVNLSDFTYVGEATTVHGYGFSSAVIDTEYGFAYFGSGKFIHQVRLSDFRYMGGGMRTGEYPGGPAVIDNVNGFAYFGIIADGRSVVKKVRLSNFTYVGNLDLNLEEARYTMSAVIDVENGFAYFGTATWPGKIVKIDLSDFTVVGELTFDNGEDTPSSAVIDTTNGFAYFGTDTVPGIVVKIAIKPVLADFKDEVVEASENTVYFIYPDYQGIKPPGVGYAALSDWTATGFIMGMCLNSQIETTDTDSTVVDPSDGSLKLSDKTVVLFGGPLVNAPVNYYEDNRIAPLYWRNIGDTYYWYAANETRFDATAMPFTDIAAGNQDMFVVEAFTDGSGNSIFIVYGYGWKGTFAGGRFFKFVIYPNIESYTGSFYVYRWIDDDSDGFVDLDEIVTTPVVSG